MTRIVVTQIQSRGGAPLGQAPIVAALEGQSVFYTLESAALMTGQRVDTLLVALHRNMAAFDCAVYQAFPRYPQRKPRRLLSPRDMETLQCMYPVILVRR